MPFDGELEVLFRKMTTDGDRTAFRSLYHATAPKLFGVAMRILKDPQKSADAVQDTYLQIWQRASQFDAHKGTVEAWMVSIVRFRAIDLVRRERTRAEYFDAAAVDDVETEQLPHDMDGAPEQAIVLRACLERLEPDQRRALLEVHLRGYTGEELAARDQIPVGTIKSRVRRGLINLRSCMERQF